MVALLASLTFATASLARPAARDDLQHPKNRAAVVTYHSDNLRTGWNAQETALTQSAVASSHFGFVQMLATDGLVSAQPLYVPNLSLPGSGRHNVLIVATEHDSVYAYDADKLALLWQRSFIIPSQNVGPEPTADTNCKVVSPWIGISSTPAIDPATHTLFVVAKTVQIVGSTPTYFQTLHALALESGRDRVAPVVITGTFFLSNGQQVNFDPEHTYDRAGLLLANGIVYTPFSTMCDGDKQTSHGWAFAYSTKNLAPAGGFNTTLDATGYEFRGSIWQATYGIAGDAAGNVYFATANGAFDAYPSGTNYGDSVLRMSPALTVDDYFTPYNEAMLEQHDLDFGSGGVMLLPDQSGPDPHLAVAAGKSTAIYLLNRDDLGKFTPSGPDRVLQSIPFSSKGVWGGPAYFSDAKGTYVYYALYGGPLMALQLSTSPAPQLTLASQTRVLFGGTGTTPTVSSNGTKRGTAIVWAITRPERGSQTAMELEAFNADNLARRLFDASVGMWPNPNSWPFLTPTVVDGKVFVGGPAGVSVFGLH
jgi:hypothetical protein